MRCPTLCDTSQVTQLILHRDETGESKRFAFVTFADKESATACLEKLDGLEVAGKALAVRARMTYLCALCPRALMVFLSVLCGTRYSLSRGLSHGLSQGALADEGVSSSSPRCS